MEYTIELLQEISNKYKTRGEMRKYDYNAYNKACKLKIIDTLFSKHENNGFYYNKKPKGYWTLKKLKKK